MSSTPTSSTDEATAALLRLASGEAAGTLEFRGADVSAACLGERVRGAVWWDAGHGGVRLTGVALAGATLRGANLAGADLAGADLSRTLCSGIVLTRARLEEANFEGADLIGATMTEVDAGEVNLANSLLEDAQLMGARLRFANLAGAVMDGADFADADLWGARLADVAAERTSFRRARLDEASLQKADLAGADLTEATLRRANLGGANLRGAVLRDAVMEGAVLAGADLGGAILPHVSLTSCDLDGARFAGAWLERTRMRAAQLGGATGEERAGEFAAARESYIVLEENFRSLGIADDASWAFRRRRRMGKRLHRERLGAAVGRRDWRGAVHPGLQWVADVVAEWVCDYGESVPRVGRTLVTVLVLFAGLYWATGCLTVREGSGAAGGFTVVNYLLFSLDSMTTVGTSEVALKPASQLGVLLSSIETVVGVVLLGLFGFVLGVRMRN